MTTDFWELYNEAKREVEHAMADRVNEMYITKLETRIEELEAVTDDTNETLLAMPVVEQMKEFVRVMNADTRLADLHILKIKLVRAAYGITLKEAKDILDSVTAETYDDLPF